jgi:hypothetical protein
VTRACVLVMVMPRYSRSMVASSYYAHRPQLSVSLILSDFAVGIPTYSSSNVH